MKVDQSSTELINENAQMAESVDALVSNTSAFTGMPVRLRLWVHSKDRSKDLSFCFTNIRIGIGKTSVKNF